MADTEHQILQLLGQIQGELNGIQNVMAANHNAMQQRINDVVNANEIRFKAVEDRLAKAESNHMTLLLRTGAAGGLTGGVVAVGIEMIRMAMKLGAGG